MAENSPSVSPRQQSAPAIHASAATGRLGVGTNFLRRYLAIAPAGLALERSIECDLLAQQEWQRPVLDVGCGDGVFAQILFQDKIDTGIDLDPVEVERARRCDSYHELIVCPGDRIPKPDASYRTAFSNSVLEHIPAVVPVLKEVHRLLMPGGKFYITIPTDRLEHATLPARVLAGLGLKRQSIRYGKFYNRFWRHHHAYSEQKWRSLFETAGFSIVEERSYVPTNLSTLYDVLTPVALPSFIFKKVLGRWVLSSLLRKVTSSAIHAVLAPAVASLKRGGGSCLVFYCLEKRTSG